MKLSSPNFSSNNIIQPNISQSNLSSIVLSLIPQQYLQAHPCSFSWPWPPRIDLPVEKLCLPATRPVRTALTSTWRVMPTNILRNFAPKNLKLKNCFCTIRSVNYYFVFLAGCSERDTILKKNQASLNPVLLYQLKNN